MTVFKKDILEKFPEMDKFTRTIEKVHGSHHPELVEVRRFFLEIQEETKKSAINKAEVDKKIQRLRAVTSNYTPPADGCQAYQKTYQMLKEMDESFQR